MKKIIGIVFCALFFIIMLDEKILNESIYDIYNKYYNRKTYSIVTNLKALSQGKYTYMDHSSYVHSTENYYPKNKNELLDVYYTILNNGWENFSYYCSNSYGKCLKDIRELSDELGEFSSINQIVHPYNSYKTIQSNYNSNKRIDLSITKKYSNEDINKIEKKMNKIINELKINSYSSVEDKIKVFHDYIANTNKYDVNKINGNSKYNSDSAIGTLFEGYSICSGYTDTMAIFLNMIGLDNVRVANENHTWNVVKINNKWKHIDLTWDDPITNTGEDIISYDYFLISTNELIKKDDKEHYFNEEIYDFL